MLGMPLPDMGTAEYEAVIQKGPFPRPSRQGLTLAHFSAQPKPFWSTSHLPVSSCLIDWGEIMLHAPNVSHKMCLR